VILRRQRCPVISPAHTDLSLTTSGVRSASGIIVCRAVLLIAALARQRHVILVRRILGGVAGSIAVFEPTVGNDSVSIEAQAWDIRHDRHGCNRRFCTLAHRLSYQHINPPKSHKPQRSLRSLQIDPLKPIPDLRKVGRKHDHHWMDHPYRRAIRGIRRRRLLAAR